MENFKNGARILVVDGGGIGCTVATMRSRADDYLQKPLERRELLAVMKRQLEQARLKIKYGLMLAGEE